MINTSLIVFLIFTLTLIRLQKAIVVAYFDMDNNTSFLQKLQAGEVMCCDFNVNYLLAIGSRDKILRIMEWKTGLGYVDMFYSPLRCHDYPITSVKFSPKGTMLVSSAFDGTAVLIDVSLGTILFTMVQRNKSNIRFCEFSFDCGELLTAAEDGTLCFWDLVHHCQTRYCQLHENDFSLRALAVSPDSEYLVSIDSGNLLKFWYTGNDSQPVCLFVKRSIHDDDVTGCDFSPVKNITGTPCLTIRYCICTCGTDNLIKIWGVNVKTHLSCETNVENYECDLSLTNVLHHDNDVLSIKFNPNGNNLVSIGLDNFVKLWEVQRGICYNTLHEHEKFVTCAAFSKDSVLLATGSYDNTLIIWNLSESDLTLDSEIVTPCNFSVHFTNVQNFITGNIDLDKANTYNEFTVVQKLTFPSVIKCIQFQSNNVLAVADGEKTVQIWEREEEYSLYQQKEVHKEHEYSVNHLDVLPGSCRVISCSTDGVILLWDLNMKLTYKMKISSCTSSLRICKFSPSSKYISAAGDDQEVYLWDANSLEFIRVMQRHDSAVSALEFTPDSKFLVSSCYGGDLILQDLEEETSKATINNAHDLGVTCCDFCFAKRLKSECTSINSNSKNNSNSYLLATGGNDSLVKLWEVTDSNISALKVLSGHGGSVNCVKFSPAETYILASCSCDTTVRIWNTESYHCLHVLNHHRSAVTTCSFSTDTSVFATGSIDKTVFILNVTQKFCYEPKGPAKRSKKLLENWTSLEIANWFSDIGCSDIAEKINSTNLTVSELFSKGDDAIAQSLTLDTEESKKFKIKLQSLKKSLYFPSCIMYKDMNVPHKFLCPITHQIMTDPVICSDGYTYDRAAVTEWLMTGKLISPVTKECLRTTKLLPYLALKINIYEFLYENKSTFK